MSAAQCGSLKLIISLTPKVLAMTDYTNNAQCRILRLVSALAGNEFAGISPGELARLTQSSSCNVTKDLFNLARAGFALEANGRWFLGTSLIRISHACAQHHQQCEARVASMKALTNIP